MNNLAPELSQHEIRERQCTRHRIELHFRLGGKDGQGGFFEEEIVTHDLSECGGSFTSERPIQVGSTLRLADRSGFISMIKITWGNEAGHSRPGMCGFRFIFPLEE